LILTAFIKFSYMQDTGFDFFYLLHVINCIGLIVLLAISEQIFGQALSLPFRTYLNFLDCMLGKGLYLCFLCLLMLEQSDKNETMFVYIVLIVAIFNIVIGYKDGIKKLPYQPWPNS